MADQVFTKIEWDGLDELMKDLEGMEQELIQNITEKMETYGLLLQEGARALAFRFGGDLEESIVVVPIKVTKTGVRGGVGTNLAYAWRLHEKPTDRIRGDLYDNGITIKDYYLRGRGERTRQKRSWRGELPGRKYLERALLATSDDFLDLMDEALAKTLEGRR